MKKRNWLLIIVPLSVAILLDQLTKAWALGLTGTVDLGFFHFVLRENHGAMLGSFANLPRLLRVVSFATSGAFIFCLYAVIQYLLPVKSTYLRAGLSFLVGGILGNVIDRVTHGYVIDFMQIVTSSFSSGVFNVADMIQWVGYGLIFFGLTKDSAFFWPENNLRKKFWVDRWFQIKYSLFLMGTGLALSLISLVFSYTYLQVALSEFVGDNQPLIDKFLVPFVVTYTMIAILFCIALLALGKFLSHRMAGPLVAFERFINDVLDDEKDTTPLRLRAGDEFKQLERLSRRIQDRFQQDAKKKED